jgi:hypothetical protein
MKLMKPSRLIDDVDVEEICCMVLAIRCSLNEMKQKRKWCAQGVPKFDYFDIKLFNFSSLFLIKLFENLSGKTKAGILL